jgi:hypothetical protein
MELSIRWKFGRIVMSNTQNGKDLFDVITISIAAYGAIL